MKKYFLVNLFVCGFITLTAVVYAQTPITAVRTANAENSVRGSGAFSSAFSNTATGRNDMNAYLLCYLSTMIYPQYLSIEANNNDESYINKLHKEAPFYEQEYRKYTAAFFTAPQYEFITEGNLAGYDPEAMVISTPQTIYVVFRGTDKVATNKKNNLLSKTLYDWGEWLLSDFDARHVSDPFLTGKVHNGMWQSLVFNGFKERLLQSIIDKGGATKKVWLTGHSLGAAQAQLFAMYMSKKGITPQGVYLYASPHPGTEEFVAELNRILPNGRLQRFDFVNDPVTTLAPYLLGYRRSGVRVYYNDIRTIDYGARERGPQEGLALIPALAGVGANAAADIVNGVANSRLKLDVVTNGGSPLCYHHPLWYLWASYKQLNTTQKARVPMPLPLPDGNMEACDVMTVERGKSSNPISVIANTTTAVIDGAAAALKEGVEILSFAATNIINNVTGSAITEGNYYLKSYASGSNLYLTEDGSVNNGTRIELTSTRTKVRIERYGAAGYVIQLGTKNITNWAGDQETRKYVLDCKADDLLDDGATSVQMWEKNGFPGVSANQRWLFIKVRDDKYVIKSLANGKLLDANNNCVNDNTCGVKTFRPVDNDPTQIWVLEKAN